jgi:hypothetical protein
MLTDQSCAAMSTGRACVSCCQQVHPTGIQALVMQIQSCDCGASGMCQSQCATEYCMSGMVASANDPCDTCIGNSLVITAADGGMSAGPCYQQVFAGCMGNMACNAYLTCGNPCNNLP